MILGSMISVMGVDYIDARTWALNICMAIWSMRLSLYIACRHNGEDWRYVKLRERYEKCGTVAYYIFAFLMIFMLQAAFAVCVNYTAMRTTSYSSTVTNLFGQGLEWTDYLGFAMFVVGLLFEVLGDAQLSAHLADPDPNKGKFCKRGLWRYTRHPNYFGDTMIWWGFYVVGCSLPNGWKTIYSPIVMNFLLRFVSGVPFLERKAALHPEWAQYAAETNCFVPWFVNKNAVPAQSDSY